MADSSARSVEGSGNAAGVGHENEQESESGHDAAVTRRQFLGVATGASMLMSFPWYPQQGEVTGEVPHRTLGRTGQKVSAIGIGGRHLGKPGLQPSERIRITRATSYNA